MRADTFRTVGNNKETCEDSIVTSGDTIVLSDGCGSGLLPDLGSQLSAYATRDIGGETVDQFRNSAIWELKMVYERLNLKARDLLSTIVHLQIQDGMASLNILGDGYWFYKTRAGNLHLYGIEYSFNAPYFIQYDMEGTAQRFADNCGGIATITDLINNQETQFYWPNSAGFHFDISVDDLEMIGIASDGIHSFFLPDKDELGDNPRVPELEILTNLLDFKQTGGYFLHRRAKAYLKELAAKNIKHYDDVSIGVFLLDS